VKGPVFRLMKAPRYRGQPLSQLLPPLPVLHAPNSNGHGLLLPDQHHQRAPPGSCWGLLVPAARWWAAGLLPG